jgi:hypothetical protein
VASLFSENIGIGTLARALPILSPGGPNSEGFPASAPANGPSIDRAPGVFGKAGEVGLPINDNHLHYNPYPNVAGPGQPKECEAGNETYAVGQTVIGHASGNPGTTHEATTREQNLYGEPYPAATLKALGLETAQEKAAKEKAAKEKANKKKGKKKQAKKGAQA